MTYVFDLRGTLVSNIAGLELSDCVRLLRQLRAGGNRLVIWTGSDPDDIPAELRELAHAVARKPELPSVHDFKRSALVDDDRALLLFWRRRGGYAIPAENMCHWLALNDQLEHEGSLPSPVSAGLTLGPHELGKVPA